MEIIEKEVVKDGKKEYGSKGVANTALGLGIAGTALGLINGGWSNGFGLFGNRNTCDNPMYLERKECQDYLDATKRYYESELKTQKALAETFVALNSKVEDGEFRLYRNQRDSFDVLNKRISDLECKQAVCDAVKPLEHKIISMQINQTNSNALGAVSLEAERRCCADSKIVNYVNSTFYPMEIAGIKTDNKTTQSDVYNPLCSCCDGVKY